MTVKEFMTSPYEISTGDSLLESIVKMFNENEHLREHCTRLQEANTTLTLQNRELNASLIYTKTKLRDVKECGCFNSDCTHGKKFFPDPLT